MTTNYPVQTEGTLAMVGRGSTGMTKGFTDTAALLPTHEPEYRR
jgi:hypothetical protein